MRFRAAGSLFSLAALTGAALLSCAEPLEPLRQETATGALEIRVATQGAEPDPDGYFITLDTASARRVGNSIEGFRSTVSAGSHVVQVTDLAVHCSLEGENPRRVTVPPGATVTVSFIIICRPNGTIQVQVTTSGENPDADGYLLTLDGQSVPVSVGVNSVHEFKGLTRGAHTLELGGIAANCRVKEGSSAQVEVTEQPAAIAFTAECSAAAALTFTHISVGYLHTCGVTPDNRAYCWGLNTHGQLGTGNSTGPMTCFFDWGCSTQPVAVTGGLRFRQISAGGEHTCGVTLDERVYCWGNNVGQLGDGSLETRHTPVLAGGGQRFRQVATGKSHTCAVDPLDQIFCWGWNGWGQLGDGTTTQRLTPVRVQVQGQLFREVTARGRHTCGLSTDNRAYCWGDNGAGQLGDRTKIQRTIPVPVYGGLTFLNLSAGGWHTCGVTTGNRAYCWGANGGGEIGDGSDYPRRLRPTAVAGGLAFRAVSAGSHKSCGVTTTDLLYCWGFGDFTPAPVEGGLHFGQVDVDGHTCGVTLGAAYCWGGNFWGQLGDSTTTDRPTPVVVSGTI